jgi:hypothetical protein
MTDSALSVRIIRLTPCFAKEHGREAFGFAVHQIVDIHTESTSNTHTSRHTPFLCSGPIQTMLEIRHWSLASRRPGLRVTFGSKTIRLQTHLISPHRAFTAQLSLPSVDACVCQCTVPHQEPYLPAIPMSDSPADNRDGTLCSRR